MNDFKLDVTMDAKQINKFIVFGYNYPYDFIEKAWGSLPYDDESPAW